MDNLLFDIRTPDKIVESAMVIPRRRPSSSLLGYAWNSRSGSRGIPARFAVESALALLWNPCSACSGISVRFGVEYALNLDIAFGKQATGLDQQGLQEFDIVREIGAARHAP
jgi:hypothetical protein